MKLDRLLTLDEQSQTKDSLRSALGDSYLCAHSRLFSAVRNEVIRSGARFTDRPSSEFLAFPLGELENIVTQKTFPYVDNVTAMSSLNNSAAGALLWDHVADNLRPNYVFHESCHLIARSRQKPSEISTLNGKLTTLLLEESFANTAEFFLIADADEPVHRIFLELNSYFTVFEDRTNLKKAIALYGIRPLFRFMHLSYLHANFLNENLTDPTLKTIIEISGFASAPELRVLRSLSENVFALNPRFRYATAEMHLRTHGHTLSVYDALEFDYLNELNKTSALIEQFDKLSDLMESFYE